MKTIQDCRRPGFFAARLQAAGFPPKSSGMREGLFTDTRKKWKEIRMQKYLQASKLHHEHSWIQKLESTVKTGQKIAEPAAGKARKSLLSGADGRRKKKSEENRTKYRNMRFVKLKYNKNATKRKQVTYNMNASMHKFCKLHSKIRQNQWNQRIKRLRKFQKKSKKKEKIRSYAIDM